MCGLSTNSGAAPCAFSPTRAPFLNTFMCPQSETVHRTVSSSPGWRRSGTCTLTGSLPWKTVKWKCVVFSMAPAVMLSSSAFREKSNTRDQLSMPSILRVHMKEKAPPRRT